MSARFVSLTGILSVLMFGGVWLAVPSDRAAPVTQGAASVYYPNCAAARAAGAAPILVGQPGYRVGMDGDDDGIACEPFYGERSGGGRWRRRG